MAGTVRHVKARVMRVIEWIDWHPRTGWYVMGLLLVNTILHVLELVT